MSSKIPPKIKKLISNLKLAVFDFDGVLTDNTVWTFANGREAVRSYRSDGFGLSKLKKLGLDVWIVSSEINPIVKIRSKKLEVNCKNGLVDKKGWIKKLSSQSGPALAQTMYVGNDINDLECMRIVGLPVAVADAFSEVKKVAKYVTKKPGGFGAVREICDLIENVKTNHK